MNSATEAPSMYRYVWAPDQGRGAYSAGCRRRFEQLQEAWVVRTDQGFAPDMDRSPWGLPATQTKPLRTRSVMGCSLCTGRVRHRPTLQASADNERSRNRTHGARPKVASSRPWVFRGRQRLIIAAVLQYLRVLVWPGEPTGEGWVVFDHGLDVANMAAW